MAVKRMEFINKKCDWFASQRDAVTKKDMWFTWLKYIRVYKLAKKFLLRSQNGINRNSCGSAFIRWKQMVHKQTQKLFEDNIKELLRRQMDHKR
jgi:hypothetical protein